MKTYTIWKITLLIVLAVPALLAYPVLASMKQAPDVYTTVTHARSDLDHLMEAVRQTGAQIEMVSLRVKTSIPALQTEEKQQSLLKTFGISAWKKEAQERVLSYRGEIKDGTIQVKIHVSFSPERVNEGGKGDLSIEIMGKEQQVEELEQRLRTYLKNDVIRTELPQIMSCVRGFYSGKLKNDLQTEKTSRILAKLDGKIVESLSEETIQSISAYSPLLSTMIRTNHQPMNVQVATHYSQYQNRTTITAGTPIITAEY